MPPTDAEASRHPHAGGAADNHQRRDAPLRRPDTPVQGARCNTTIAATRRRGAVEAMTLQDATLQPNCMWREDVPIR
jgi:hypothetical protein